MISQQPQYHWLPHEVQYIHDHWQTKSDYQLAAHLQRSARAVTKKRKSLGLIRPCYNKDKTRVTQTADYCPTPEQIRAACLEVQSSWSAQERYRREQYAYPNNPNDLETPVLSTSNPRRITNPKLFN